MKKELSEKSKKIWKVILTVGLGVLFLFYVFVSCYRPMFANVKAEPLFTEVSMVDVSISGTTGIQLYVNPFSAPVKYERYYIYIPSEILSHLTSVTLTAYDNGYATLSTVTLVSSNTASPNIFAFNFVAGEYGYWNYMAYLGFKLYTDVERGTSNDALYSGYFDDYGMFLNGSELNVSRLAEYGVIPNEDFYNAGHEAGLAEGISTGYDNGYSDGYNEGLSSTIDTTSVFEGMITFIGSIFSLEIMPGITVAGIIAIPVSFFFLKWFMQQLRG